MRLKPLRTAIGLLLLGTAISSSSSARAETPAAGDLPSSQFNVQDKTLIPGLTLSPGSYSIKMLDHLSDRMVMQVANDQGKLLATFLGLPNAKLQRAGTSGTIPFADTKKTPALRGFAFSDGTVVEFVYPKAQAVAIARQNSTRVPAIDPPSEGMPADNKLSRNDMALVTLWMLSPTLVGSESKPAGVLAERYQAPTASTAPETQVARTEQPAAVVPSRPEPQPQPLMAQVSRKPVLARLPHTAGFQPMIWLFGFASLVGALLFRFYNRPVNVA